MALAAVTLSSHEFSSFAKSLKTADLSGLKIVDGKVDGMVSYKVGIPDTVEKVGGRHPINAKWADKTYLPDDLPDAIKKKYPELHIKYPNGVKYDSLGYPDFTPYMIQVEKLDKFTPGNPKKDFYEVDKKVKAKTKDYIKPQGYTWHHHQDGTTMQLVPEDLHDAFKHTGGIAITKHGVKIK